MLKGFHNSFDKYCAWCDDQVQKGEPTKNWGDWWDEIEKPRQIEEIRHDT